jgi:hypothetical protein
MNGDGRLIYKNQGNSELLDLISSSPGRILDCGVVLGITQGFLAIAVGA